MKFSISRFFAAAGIIFLGIIAAGLVALPTLSKLKIPSTPVVSLVIVVIVALWIVALTLINAAKKWVVAIAIFATLAAMVLWNKRIVKAINDAREWAMEIDFSFFLTPGVYVSVFIALGAAALIALIFVFGRQ